MLAVMMTSAGSARAAADCPAGGDVRSQAECIDDQMSPDVIDKLYRLALSTVEGKLDPDHVPSDFIYIAEEAGETARRKGPKPLVEMASSTDVSKLVFTAHAITAFVDAVRDGYSHRAKFDGKGDAKLFASAKRVLPASCKRLAAHDNRFIRDEGERCLREINPVRPVPSSWFEKPDLTGVEAVPLSSGRGGLHGSPEGAIDAGGGPASRAPRTSQPASKPAAKKRATPPSPPPPASN